MIPQSLASQFLSALKRCALPCSIATLTFLGLITTIALLAPSTPTIHAQADSTNAITGTLPLTLQNGSFECGSGFITQTTGTTSTLLITTTGGLTETAIVSDYIHIPSGWTMVPITGTPIISSTQLFFSHDCVGDNGRERLDGIDSLVIRSEDIETPPLPGKPFDVAFYQQLRARPDTAYSVSGWMLSLCGGSAVPSDCPEDVYMAKMLGIDPTGGTDPLAETVVWTENRANFVSATNERIGWANLRTSAVSSSMPTDTITTTNVLTITNPLTITSPITTTGSVTATNGMTETAAMTVTELITATPFTTITIFARVASPFRHHGNHAFIDALTVVRSPLLTVTHKAITSSVGLATGFPNGLPNSVIITGPVTITDAVESLSIISGTRVGLLWQSELGTDINSIEGGRYGAFVDVQVRAADRITWTDLALGLPASGCIQFTAPQPESLYFARSRVRAEQYAGGRFPEQRYPGVWSDPLAFYFLAGGAATEEEICPPLLYLPVIE